MAAQKRRTTRTAAKKSTKTTEKRKAKKPKVRLSARKVYVLSGVIVCLCAASLALSAALSARADRQSQPAQVARTAPAEAVARQPAPQPKTDSARTATPPARQTPPKQSPQTAQTTPQDTSPSRTVADEPRPSPPAVREQPAPARPHTETVAPVRQPDPSRTDKSHTSPASSAPTPQPVSAQKSVEKPAFAVPPARNGATLVLVFDDAGRLAENVRRYTALPFPLTIAVLPRLPQSRACADVARSAGKEVILHQPMQAMNPRLDPGEGAIRAAMSGAEIAAVIQENLAELGPGIVGMNNHEGSLITADIVRIGMVLDVCRERGIYFLDSRTTAETKAPQAALERDMPIFEKAGPYIDNEIDRDKMLARLYETFAYANEHGRAVVIGHVDKSVDILPALLAELYPHLAAQGYRFATPSML
ncbi:MAG: divergent polysaccharide deacetylase family protein [Treponemataceae bacterium]|nr:divergent polysaccharide deacetylase family protein [Treponemataceae bacterium]